MSAFERAGRNRQDTQKDFVGEFLLFFFGNTGKILVNEVMVIEEESVVTVVFGFPENLAQEQVVS